MTNTKLIVLRGPSGAGKSTVAKALFDAAEGRVCLLNQDHYRFIFKPAGGGSKPNSDTIHKMIKHNVLAALEGGYDVILEGILNVKSYGELLNSIFKIHSKNNYIYYFDVSFEETVRRHSIRKTDRHTFDVSDMQEWYPSSHRSNHRLERIVPETSSIEETVTRIRKETSL